MSMPKFFCVENTVGYKVYLNTLYNGTNVLWPQDHVDARGMTIKFTNDSEKTVTYRKWNGRDYKQISWIFTGSSIVMRLNAMTITCPVIEVSDISLLPYNTCSVMPMNKVFVDEVDRVQYEKPDIYTRDPNSSEYMSSSVPVSSAITTPVRNIFVSTCHGDVCSTNATPAKKGLPTHVSNIVLDAAISKNEICPISNEPITRANATVTSCGHVFCKDSINEWFKIKNECPVCKQACL